MTTREEINAKAELIRKQRKAKLLKKTTTLLKQFETWECSLEEAASACACALNLYGDPLIVIQVNLHKVLRVEPQQIE